MSLALLWILHLGFVLAALATALVWTVGAPRARRGVADAVSSVPFLALAYLTWRVGWLRFGLGIQHAPWRFASTLLVGNVVGAVLLWRRREAAAGWSRATLSFGAFGLALLEVAVLSDLHARVELRRSDLRLEAELLAQAALPPKPETAANAAPLIVEATEILRAVERGNEVVPRDHWIDTLEGREPLDLYDPELAPYLGAIEPALELARRASARPRFRPVRDGNGFEWLWLSDALDIVELGQGLLLRARVRLARGEAASALEDLAALARLADHLLDVPSLGSTRLSAYLRGLLRDELRTAWRRGELTSAEVARVSTVSRVRDALEPALRLEEAYHLDQFGSLTAAESMPSWSFQATGPETDLCLIFLLEAEVRAFRGACAELRAHAQDRRLILEPLIEGLRARGLGATLMVPMSQEAV